MKKRTKQTRTGNCGVTAVMRYCDQNNLIFQAEPREDYGIDCYIELEADTHPQNFIIGIQLKAGPSYKRSITGTSFSIYVSKDDIAYWLAANYPVFFVYYDEGSNHLYFKHVQDQLQHYTDISECKKFVFTEEDDASGGRLASYARGLLGMTPNLLNRLEITKAEYPFLKIDKHSYPIIPLENHSGLANIETHVSKLLECSGRNFPRYPIVIGHSVTGRWILTLDFEDLGAIGASNVTAVFLDTLDWATYSVPLFNHLQWYREEEDKASYCANLQDRANKVQQLIRQFGITQARAFYQGPYANSEIERPTLALGFGAELFDIELARYSGRDAVVLTNHAYSPARSVSILNERLTPVRLIDRELNGNLDIYTLDQTRRFDHIYEIILSSDAKWITFSIVTNTDHSCWGCPLAHLVHLRIDELREFCLQALSI
jgi:hypothetical protein